MDNSALKRLLTEHLRAHPAAQAQDAVKFLYQGEFGGGHLIADPAAALARLRAELDACPAGDGPLSEPLGGGLCRLNLAAAKGKITPETLCAMFTATADGVRGGAAAFAEKLALARETGLPGMEEYLRAYAGAGFPAVSHSEAYRRAYAPAYRVVRQEYADFFPLFAAVDRAPRPLLIGIDGGCASGKTTLGALLASVYDMELYHADDYFLPFALRTEERLSEPGGNLHRERLRAEVLEPLAAGRAPVTRAFDCGSGLLGPAVSHPLKALGAVEGSYSLHPELRGFYGLKVFLETDGAARRARLRARCGDEALARFYTRWIPLEERYFAACGVRACADLIFRT